MRTISIKIGLVCLLCCFWSTWHGFAQRIYMEQEMDRYNLLVELQRHLDTLRFNVGNDLKVSAFVAGESEYDIDSIVLYYSASGKISKTDWHQANDNGFYLDATFIHHYDRLGRLMLLEHESTNQDYWSHRYELTYFSDGSLASVTSFNFTADKTDTNGRYLYHYQKGLVDTVLYQGWRNGSWVDMNRRVYGWNENGQMTYENWESTASYDEFSPMFGYPKTYEYDSNGRLQYEYLGKGENDTLQIRFKYEYLGSLRAFKYFEFIRKDTIETLPSTYYWYNEDSLLVEELYGWNIKDAWLPTSRDLYHYYPNGLLQSRTSQGKWPQEVVWDYITEVRRYYYNKTE